MLILIAGVSGGLGWILAKTDLDRGCQIRGLGHSPSKLPARLLERLEYFIQCDSYNDKEALDKAVLGVDAVTCAYVSHAEAILESQLSHLRAVERAGIKVYHTHSWNSTKRT